jgi:hypothetical protein
MRKVLTMNRLIALGITTAALAGAGFSTSACGFIGENCFVDGTCPPLTEENAGGMGGTSGGTANGGSNLSIPQYWNGYFLVQTTANNGTPSPGCPYGFHSQEVFFTNRAEPHQCPTCKCLEGTSTCPTPILKCSTSPVCQPEATMDWVTVQLTDTMDTQDGDCKTSNTLHNKVLCRIEIPTVACDDSIAPDIPPPFKDKVHVCTAEPATVLTNASQLCIRRSGEHNCDADWPHKIPAFADYSGTPVCTACQCNFGSCSTVGFKLFDTNNCTDSSNDKPIQLTSTACAAVGFLTDNSTVSVLPLQANPPNGQPTCSTTGGDAVDQVTGINPTTFCCK